MRSGSRQSSEPVQTPTPKTILESVRPGLCAAPILRIGESERPRALSSQSVYDCIQGTLRKLCSIRKIRCIRTCDILKQGCVLSAIGYFFHFSYHTFSVKRGQEIFRPVRTIFLLFLQDLLSLADACGVPALCADVSGHVMVTSVNADSWLEWLLTEHGVDAAPIRRQVVQVRAWFRIFESKPRPSLRSLGCSVSKWLMST